MRIVKTLLAILTVGLMLVAGGTVMLLTWQSQANRELTAVNTQLTRELQQAHESVSAVTAEKAGISNKLAALETREKELRNRVESLESAAEAAPRPYRVRAFLGRENIGDAWMVPSNVARDPKTGRYTFEPILVIDEAARNHFTEHHTNVVEREVYTTEVYPEGYAYPYFYPVAPGRPEKPGHPPGHPGRPTQPERPNRQVAPQPDARAQVFAPPMSIVNSRPQVVGTPATSPINQRVFAP